MGAKEFDSMLRKLIPATVSEFKKLEAGNPYHFDRWDDGCMYYWFGSTSKPHKKRVFVSEAFSALQHLRTTGAFDRNSFPTLCPKSESDGGCGFAVAGRILEALGVAKYSGRRAGFTLTDPVKATSLLE
jgi:hypothetical protein